MPAQCWPSTPVRHADECLESLSRLREVLESQRTHETTRDELKKAARGYVEVFAEDVARLLARPLTTAPEPLFVVDTNALIAHPSLIEWRLTEQPFCIVLVPQVVRELDTMKMLHRSDTVRAKALTLTREIKEYGRRGAFGGTRAALVNKVSRIQCLPIEPKFDRLPTWLDPTLPDDRILASALSLSMDYPWTPVCLVTGDVNMCNRAFFAGMACYDTDDGITPAGG